MLSKADQATFNLDQARDLRAAGLSYRDIRGQLAVSPAQLSYIRRTLKREKSARTRLMNQSPLATDRDIPIRQIALPIGLRTNLVAAGFRTLGDLSDRLVDGQFSGLLKIAGVGPHKARLVLALLERHGLASTSGDLQMAVERLFPDLISS